MESLGGRLPHGHDLRQGWCSLCVVTVVVDTLFVAIVITVTDIEFAVLPIDNPFILLSLFFFIIVIAVVVVLV